MARKLRKLYPPRIDGASFVVNHIPKRISADYEQLIDNRPRCTEIAYERIREYLFEIGRNDMNLEIGWMTHAAEVAGITYATARAIIHRDKTSVGPTVVEQISRKLRCPVSVFYDATPAKVAMPKAAPAVRAA